VLESHEAAFFFFFSQSTSSFYRKFEDNAHLSEISPTALNRLLETRKSLLSMEHQLCIYPNDFYVCDKSDRLFIHWTNCACAVL